MLEISDIGRIEHVPLLHAQPCIFSTPPPASWAFSSLALGSPRWLQERAPAASAPTSPVVHQIPCNGRTYTYQVLAGYGFVPSNANDKFGDTVGGYGSLLALDLKSWRKMRNGNFTGVMWAIPDRGCMLPRFVVMEGMKQETSRQRQMLRWPILRHRVYRSHTKTPCSSPALMALRRLASTPTT